MSDIILRPPYFKPKAYCINPIVKYGIPKEADSRRNPKVIGTPAWEKFWYEELHRCLNGYQCGGLWVPGRYYYYMNYTTMSTISGAITPDVTDLHLELAYLIEYCKANGKNIMSPKGRRKGISEATQKMVIDYGWRFTYNYKAGIASGKKDFIDDFVAKLRYGWMGLPPELYTGTLLDNDSEIIAGYSQKNIHGAFEQAGTMNTLYLRTIHSDATGFKGNFYNDIIVEEVGETEKFLEFWRGTKDALTDGAGTQVGTAFIYGTGGNMDKGSKDFKKAWSRNEKENFIDTNNFIRFLIPAQRFYFYGGATNPKRQLPAESELFKKYKPYQLIGVEDIELSIKDIVQKGEELLKKGNKKDYDEHRQNNPITEADIFRKTVTNNFDTAKISDRLVHLESMVSPPWTKYKLEYVKTKDGAIKQPVEVIRVPLERWEDQDVCVWMTDEGSAFQKNYSNRYCAGIDSYNIDESKNSKSLGAMLVLDRNTMKPVAAISCRPERKEIFFEMCMKLSIYYKMWGNVLGDVASDAIIKHFEVAGCYGYLADRPVKFESAASEQSHSKWVRLTTYSRPLMVGLMQAHVNDFCHTIDFPELLNQIGNYDEVEIGSDNDLADAYGIALMQHVSCAAKPRNNDDESFVNKYKLPEFVDDGKGGLVLKTGGSGGYRSIEQDDETLGLLFGK